MIAFANWCVANGRLLANPFRGIAKANEAETKRRRRAILHRKNALFDRTRNGARVGDLFMSLIYTCQLNEANPLDYLTEWPQHAEVLAACPERRMPWNYRDALV